MTFLILLSCRLLYMYTTEFIDFLLLLWLLRSYVRVKPEEYDLSYITVMQVIVHVHHGIHRHSTKYYDCYAVKSIAEGI